MTKIISRQQLIAEIADALDMSLDEGCFFLNLTEQEVGLYLSDYYGGDDCAWPHDGDEVVRIDPLPSNESFVAMEEFTETQPHDFADKLYSALNGGRPFARFRGALEALDLLDDWYSFKNKWYSSKAEEWIRDKGVDFVDGKIICTGNTLTWFEEDD